MQRKKSQGNSLNESGVVKRPQNMSFSITMGAFCLFGLVFVGLGGVLYVLSEAVQEVIVPYANRCILPAEPRYFGTYEMCNVQFEIPQEMKKPVFAYYELQNFYQNHRRYFSSKSFKQLRGDHRTVAELKKDCDPILTNNDLAPYITKAVDGITPLNLTEPANPCGLIAKSFFTDQYRLFGPNAIIAPDWNNLIHNITMNNSVIAWPSDIEYNFANLRPLDELNVQDWKKIQWIDVTNQHFIVWMRSAGLPTFRKLYGRIDQDLVKSNYWLSIKNAYDETAYDGNKTFVLSTTNALGGRNYFLAYLYIIVGMLSIGFAIIFFALYITKMGFR